MAQGFLQSDNGNFSSARLMFVIGLSWCIVFTTLGGFILKWTPGEIIAVFTATSAVFVALKLGQKPMENGVKNGNNAV
jgi:Na+-driven multidrug efflux pump